MFSKKHLEEKRQNFIRIYTKKKVILFFSAAAFFVAGVLGQGISEPLSLIFNIVSNIFAAIAALTLISFFAQFLFGMLLIVMDELIDEIVKRLKSDDSQQ